MKNVNLKIAVSGLVMAALFLFVGIGQANAQSGSTPNNGLYTVPQGPFVSVEEAEDILLIESKNMKAQLENLIEGSGSYREVLRELNFYTLISDALKSGNGVGDSIVEGTRKIAYDRYGGISLQKQFQLKQKAIDLLSL